MENISIKQFDIEELGTTYILAYDREYLEGEELSVTHRSHERNTEVVNVAKSVFKATHHGRLYCEVCGFDFREKYGEHGIDFIEAHHVKPIAKRNKNEPTKVEDIVLLCSNCHSIVHRKQPWLTILQLKQITKMRRTEV